MAKSIRIRTKPDGGDNFVKIKLDHTFDFLEVLSLRLTQSEVYRKFAADYGVIVGRVIANRGFGVPNAKVSIFVPLDEDEGDPDVIGKYPYQTASGVNNQGVRYNLLEDRKQGKCHTPVGTFPNKRKILDNDVWLEIYDKYYKYTTTTNESGDYMIFGVPIGNQNIHMDVDISDIGFVSVKPYELKEQGYTDNLFESNTTFKGGTDLNALVQIQSRDFGVNVIPFWGDNEENEVGINRVDFNLSLDITPTALFFGSIYSDSPKTALNKGCRPRKNLGKNCDLNTGTGRIEIIRRISSISNEVEVIQTNSKSKIDENGNWAVAIPMNLNTVVTDEFGNLIPSEDPTIGVPTTALVRFRISLDENRFGFRKRTAHYLVPNLYNRFEFDENTDDDDFATMRWKKVYTVTNYIPRYQKDNILQDETRFFTGIKNIAECENTSPFPFNRIDTNLNPLYNILCIIIWSIGQLIDIINNIVEFVLFDFIVKFVCSLKHPFNGERRSACRCQGCLRLNTGLAGPSTSGPNVPVAWTFGTPDANGNGVADELDCAICYDAGDSQTGFPISTVMDALVPSITVGLGGTGTGLATYPVIPATSGAGDGVELDVTVNAVGDISSITATVDGTGYDVGDTLTIAAGLLGVGSTVVTITLVLDDLVTTVTVDGDVIDCYNGGAGFDFADCKGLCLDCDLSIIPLVCNGINYDSGKDWSECVREQLAEELGVVTYEFYNDWVIGSLYSFLFNYKIRFKKKGKSLERFCDFNCRPQATSPDADDEHRKNVCRRAYIAEKKEFNQPTEDWELAEIDPTDGRGLIVEYNDFLYYASRHDIDINEAFPPPLTVGEKEKLLFATNILEIGSSVNCDIDGVPFLVDRLEGTSYQKDDGVSTLFNVNNCITPISDINFNGIQLSSQAGIDILVAETQSPSPVIIIGEDGEGYLVSGSTTGFPDYDGNVGVVIFDRDDIILREYLCENFNYYSSVGTYSTTSHPTGVDFLTDEDGDIVESLTDVCTGFDDSANPAERMITYYMYFGIRQGVTSLDKLKELYFDNCIE